MAELKPEILEISLPLRPEQPDAPKNETARISVLRRPARIAATTQSAPALPTPQSVASIETIPRPLCWAALAISALIFLIQIWNYVVS
jgi:hypothetical protein